MPNIFTIVLLPWVHRVQRLLRSCPDLGGVSSLDGLPGPSILAMGLQVGLDDGVGGGGAPLVILNPLDREHNIGLFFIPSQPNF